MAFAFPEPHARYLYGGEVLNFATEYFHVPGSFEIYLWGLEFLVEGQDDWRPVFHWRVDHHDGSLGSFGARLGEYDNHKVVVFGTQDKAGYQPAGTVIYIGERPAITDVTVVPQGRQISLSLPTNRFDATNGFIIERFTGLGKAAECVASSETLTNLFAFDTADAPAEFYRCQFGLHVVALPIADTNLAAAVKAAIALRNVPPTNALYDVDLNGVLALDASERQVGSLAGIECLSGLTSLNASVNNISDATPLANLPHLSFVALHDNHVSDVSPFGNMPWLTELHLWNNGITNATPLPPLVNLRALHLGWNGIRDADFLQEMTNLWFLAIWNNQLSDITSLAGLKNLTQLHLSGNLITDLSPLIANAAARGIGTNTEIWLKGNPLSNTNQVTTLCSNDGVDVHWS